MALQPVKEIARKEIKIIEVIGEGGFGVVYKAQWGDHVVAAKYYNEIEDETFTTEVRQLSSVQHPNIVALYGKCTSLPVCIVMELADGGTLERVLHNRPHITFTFERAMSWIKQCADGVAYLHAIKPRPMIHRDLKPENLLLFKDTTVLKLGDFGLVTILRTLMTDGIGPIRYMAPEFQESNTYDQTCDVYSFGVILWEIMAREIPFKELETNFAIICSVVRGDRPPITNCPEQLANLITRCWHQDPAQRPAMSKVVMELESINLTSA